MAPEPLRAREVGGLRCYDAHATTVLYLCPTFGCILGVPSGTALSVFLLSYFFLFLLLHFLVFVVDANLCYNNHERSQRKKEASLVSLPDFCVSHCVMRLSVVLNVSVARAPEAADCTEGPRLRIVPCKIHKPKRGAFDWPPVAPVTPGLQSLNPEDSSGKQTEHQMVRGGSPGDGRTPGWCGTESSQYSFALSDGRRPVDGRTLGWYGAYFSDDAFVRSDDRRGTAAFSVSVVAAVGRTRQMATCRRAHR